MADIASEMRAALTETAEPGAANALEGEETSTEALGAAEGTGEDTPVQPEGSEEAEEATPEESKKAEEAKKKADEAKEKDSSYKRLQKRAEISKEDAKAARKDAAEALAIANDWRRKALTISAELRRVLQDAAKTGYRRDPRDDRVLASELRNAEIDVQRGVEEHVQAATADAETRELSRQYTEDAADLAVKYLPGDKFAQGKILRAFAAMVESSPNEDVSMEEVATLLRDRTARRAGPRNQLEKNRAAPRPLRSANSSRPVEFKANATGMKNFLKSQGLA